LPLSLDSSAKSAIDSAGRTLRERVSMFEVEIVSFLGGAGKAETSNELVAEPEMV
jgi:hypothetical protein